MFDVSIEANASELIGNKPLNANSLIHRRPLSLNTLPHLFESEFASSAACSFNISTSSKNAESDVVKVARTHRLSKATGP
jgi:hypothetical protein